MTRSNYQLRACSPRAVDLRERLQLRPRWRRRRFRINSVLQKAYRINGLISVVPIRKGSLIQRPDEAAQQQARDLRLVLPFAAGRAARLHPFAPFLGWVKPNKETVDRSWSYGFMGLYEPIKDGVEVARKADNIEVMKQLLDAQLAHLSTKEMSGSL